jgi:chromosome segregation ATPase
MLLGFRCDFLNMLRGEEERLSPELQARLASLRTTHEQYMATAVVDRYACGHMVQLYNDLRGEHGKHQVLCTELDEFKAELAYAKAQRDALGAECENLRAECTRLEALVQSAGERLAQAQNEAQERTSTARKTRDQLRKTEKTLAGLQKTKDVLEAEIELLREQQGKEKVLLCHERGLPGLEQAVYDLEKVLESTPLHTMMVCQALSNIDGCALDP